VTSDELIDPYGYSRRPMWLSVIPPRILPEADKAVWCALADCLGKKAYAYPSIERICFDTGSNRDAVRNALNRLQKLRLLRRHRTQGSSMYYLEAPKALAEATLEIRRMKKAKPEGVRHDYQAYQRVRELALEKWLAELGPQAQTTKRTGSFARRAA
jgi:hypothetical protein